MYTDASKTVAGESGDFPAGKSPSGAIPRGELRVPRGEFRVLGRPARGEQIGVRLDLALAQAYKFLSRAEWQRRIRNGRVLVNGTPSQITYAVREGDQFEFFHESAKEPDVERSLPIIYQHEGVMAVFKPPHLPMHENGPYRINTVAHVLREIAGPGWAAVHRLDLETSGVLLCGETLALRQNLAGQLADRKVIKRYLAICRGTPPDEVWRVDQPIGEPENSEIRIKKWVDPDGQPAVTDFEVLGQGPGGACLLRAYPRTGRTNQIRIHAAWSGLPLVGDKRYHPDEQVFIDYYNHGNTEDVIERAGHFRCALHAEAITFSHPATGEVVEVEAPMAKDMQLLWDRLKQMAVAAPAREPSIPKGAKERPRFIYI